MRLVEYLMSNINDFSEMNVKDDYEGYVVINGETERGQGVIFIAPYRDVKDHIDDYDRLEEGLSSSVRDHLESHSGNLDYTFVAVMHTDGKYVVLGVIKDTKELSRWMREEVDKHGDINYLSEFDWDSDLQKYL